MDWAPAGRRWDEMSRPCPSSLQVSIQTMNAMPLLTLCAQALGKPHGGGQGDQHSTPFRCGRSRTGPRGAPAHCPRPGSPPPTHDSPERGAPQPWGWAGEQRRDESHPPHASATAPSSWVSEVKHFLLWDSQKEDVPTTQTLPTKLCPPKHGWVGGQVAGDLATEHGRAKEGLKPEAGTEDKTTAGSHMDVFLWMTPCCPCLSTHFCSLVWLAWEVEGGGQGENIHPTTVTTGSHRP